MICSGVIFPDGTYLAGDYLTTILDDFPHAVKQFQVYQHADYSITLRVVPNKAYVESDLEIKKVAATLGRKGNNQVGVKIQQEDSLPHDQGKTRYIISEIK